MLNYLRKIALIAVCSISVSKLFAQTEVQHESFMDSNGKIYVVMAVVITIVAGILIYLINIDRKISKLEKNNTGIKPHQ